VRIFAVLFALLFAAPVRAAETDLLFPDDDTFARLRLTVSDNESPEVAWTDFLAKLHEYFDRDGSGSLSEAEAKRVFALPLPGGRDLAPDFTAMDANRDGKATPAEFRAFYRERGFTPVTVVVQSAPAEALALGDALFRHLDRDSDGKLSAAELERAVSLLKRFDEDEDEVLTASELLGANRPAGAAKPAGLKLATEKGEPVAGLKLALGGKPALTSGNQLFRLSEDGARLHIFWDVCSLTIAKDDPATGFRAAKGFYLAQFKAAAGDKPAAKALFEDDPAAQVLAGLFDAADRDGDGKLARTGLEAFFELIEMGLACRVIVTATDRGRNLFDLFDADGDGRLTLDELSRAAKNLPDLARYKSLERARVRASYRLALSRGPVGESFGPVPFGAAAKPKPTAALAARGPKWFVALDKNDDGFVSAREFVGSPELFAKLDTNGDGRISAEEAEVAKP
jgi:Ca2+-binding EF-hand superfamily protein